MGRVREWYEEKTGRSGDEINGRQEVGGKQRKGREIDEESEDIQGQKVKGKK